MGKPELLTIILVLGTGTLEAFAFSRQRRHYENTAIQLPRVANCGEVSYTEKSRVPNHFLPARTDISCRNIESGIPAVLHLHEESLSCNYSVEAYSMEDCEGDEFEYPFNSTNKYLKLNRLPVCSFQVKYAPLPGDKIHVKFLGSYRRENDDSSHQVTEAGCYNLCGSTSNDFYYPDTIQLSKVLQNNYRERYNEAVTLYSSTQCGNLDDDEMDTSSEIGDVRHGANLVALTSLVPVRSYMIFRKYTRNGFNY